MDPFKKLNDELVSTIFTRLDFPELHSLRRTCRSFESLLLSQNFCRLYNAQVNRKMLTIMYGHDDEDPSDHWLTIINEEDEGTIRIRLQFDLEEDEVLELIAFWKTITLFRCEERSAFIIYNFWSEIAIEVPYIYEFVADELHSAVVRFGTRIYEDARDNLDYILEFIHRREINLHYFSYCSRDPQQVQRLGAQVQLSEIGPVNMIIPAFQAPGYIFFSLDGGNPIYANEAYESLMTEHMRGFINNPPPNVDQDEYDPLLLTTNEGFCVIIKRSVLFFNGRAIHTIYTMDVFSAQRHPSIGEGYLFLTRVPNLLRPIETAQYRDFRLRVVEGCLNLTFKLIPPQEENMHMVEWIILRYNIEERVWISKRNLMPEGTYGAIYSGKTGITPAS